VKAVFADSFYFFALLNPNDAAHQRAADFARSFEGLIVSTAWVFTELGDGLAAPRDRGVFVRWLDRFSTDTACRLILPTPALFQAGTDLYRVRSDKSWSLTDCLAFVTMAQEGIAEALTADHHFTQAGFTAILADDGK